MQAAVRPVSDITELKTLAASFQDELSRNKSTLAPPDFWYPYRTLANLWHFDSVLTGANRDLLSLAGDMPVVDIGGADGDLSFFFERFGCTVHLIDNSGTSGHAPKAALLVKEALGSTVEVFDMDLDEKFEFPAERYGLAFFLGILYHLKNPFYVLEKLAACARFCLLSTRVARLTPDKRTEISGYPLAYLLDAGESNNDPTNYWIFSEPCLQRLVRRAGWDIRDYGSVGNTASSDPSNPDADERAFCLLESTRLS